MKTKRNGDVEAKISFLTTEEGGHKEPVFSGYRPQFYYDGLDWVAVHHYDVSAVYPGETAIVRLSFLNPQSHLGKLYVGKTFLIREGQRIVASGTITNILDLEKSAKRVAETRNRTNPNL